MAAFPTALLRDLCTSVEYGYTASSTVDSAVGPHFLRITDIVPERLDWESVPFCAIEPKKLTKHRLRTGDIVIARTGATTGWAKYIKDPPEAVFASYLVRVRPDSFVNARYIGFIVESAAYKNYIQQQMGGAAQPNANAQVLTSFEVPLPPFPVQRRISEILSAYDELIENNQRRIKVLESIASTLYKSAIYKLHVANKDKQLQDECALGSVLSLEYGKSLTSKNRRNGPYAVVGSSGVTGRHDEFLVSGPGVVIGRAGNAGSVHYVHEDFYPIDSAFYVELREDALGIYTALFLLQELNLPRLASGSAVPGINRNAIYAELIVLPPLGHMEKFEEICQSLFRQRDTLARKCENLRRTRDLLLPRLLSGELEV